MTFPAAFAARFVESAPVESARVAEIRSIGFQEMVELNELMVVVPNEPNVRHEVVRQPAELRLENFEEERLGDEAVDQLFAQFGTCVGLISPASNNEVCCAKKKRFKHSGEAAAFVYKATKLSARYRFSVHPVSQSSES